jgi:hypothetical protein
VYVIAKAEKIDPIIVFEKWNSSMIFGAVTEIVTRSRYEMKYNAHRIARTT